MASLECVLCFAKIEKKGDVNLVQGKRDFNVTAEIETLHFVVRPISKHICRNCLSFLKQRANQRRKLDELDAKLFIRYQEKAQDRGITVKMKSSAKRLVYGDESSSASGAVRPHSSASSKASQRFDKQHLPIFTPISPISSQSSVEVAELPHIITTSHLGQSSTPDPVGTSTPRRISTTCASVYTRPRPPELPQAKTTEAVVSITVQWNSKTSNRVLPDDLNSLGKMMCRGTYTQIARAAWRNCKIREQLISFFLKEIDKESCNICSSKRPSLLRLTKKKDILTFSLSKFDEEAKERIPLLRSVLMSASVRKTKTNTQRSDLYWMPAICMAAAVCVKNRSPCMTVLQLLNSLFIQHSGLMVNKLLKYLYCHYMCKY